MAWPKCQRRTLKHVTVQFIKLYWRKGLKCNLACSKSCTQFANMVLERCQLRKIKAHFKGALSTLHNVSRELGELNKRVRLAYA